MPDYFHCAPIPLAPGSVVLPGNFGRIIAARGSAHPLWAREDALETVRRAYYPLKPSRLQCTFSCPTEEAAQNYRSMMSARDGNFIVPIIYRVQKTEPNAADHLSDWNVVEPLPGHPATMDQIAHHYWCATFWVKVVGYENFRCEEVISTSPLRIVDRID